MIEKEEKLLQEEDEALGVAFHNWKRENPISKMLFKYLKSLSDEATTMIVSAALSSDLSQDKLLKNYYVCSAKLQVISEILNLELEDIKNIRELS